MKKILLATTMMVGTAGLAAAEVTLTGDARMGLIGSDTTDAAMTSRARVAFALSGATDGGLEFGASFRADNAGAASEGAAGSVFVSGAFGKLSMGDVDSADKATVGQLSGVGLTGLGDSNEVEYSADGVSLFGLARAVNGYSQPATALYSYSTGALTVAGSMSNTYGNELGYAVAASYAAGDLTVAAGYGSNHLDGTFVPAFPVSVHGDATDLSVSAAYAMGGTTVKAIYQNKQLNGELFTPGPTEDISGDAVSYGLSVDHTIDALTLTGFVIATDASDAIAGDLSSSSTEDSMSFTRYGIGASYDLGGGAKVVGGIARVESAYVSTPFPSLSVSKAANTVYDLGLSFSF